MGNFTPRDALRIGIALVIISFAYSFLSLFFAPNSSIDPFGMPAFFTNYGFAVASFILMLVGIFFIILGMAMNRKH